MSGLVFATWHLPLVFLTSLLPIGNPVISLPLFYAAVVAGSFFYGYLRLASGSVWPASIAHATHNSVSVMITGFTVTSSPLLVNVYLLGEFGIVITAAAAIAAALVSRLVLATAKTARVALMHRSPIAQAGPPCRKPILSDTGVDRCLAVRDGTGFLVMNGKAFGATNPHTLRRLKPAHRNSCGGARRPRRYG